MHPLLLCLLVFAALLVLLGAVVVLTRVTPEGTNLAALVGALVAGAVVLATFVVTNR